MAAMVVFIAVSLATLVMVIINFVQVEHLKKQANAVSESGGSSDRTQDIESLLVRGENGNKMPKKAYWVKMTPVSAATTTAKEVIKIDTGDAVKATDGDAFMKDIESGRIALIYRPDHNIIFKATKQPAAVDQIVLEHINGQTGLVFAPQGSSTTAGALTTIIGLPAMP